MNNATCVALRFCQIFLILCLLLEFVLINVGFDNMCLLWRRSGPFPFLIVAFVVPIGALYSC